MSTPADVAEPTAWQISWVAHGRAGSERPLIGHEQASLEQIEILTNSACPSVAQQG